MATEYNEHLPVMLDEVLSFVKKGGKETYVDLTLGRGGHASHILSMLGKGSSFYGVDRDEDALSFCQDFLKPYGKKASLHFVHSPYSKAIPILKDTGLRGADFILMDIGVSSPQFDDPNRGFSYRFDAPLDMRMDQNDPISAKDIINTYTEKELFRVFHDLGEADDAYPVCKRIVAARQEKPIETTFQLVDVIKSALPERILNKKGHPAKQFFLGLRYEVNHEMDELQEGLEEAIRFLNPKGRLVIISFNSEEDRAVKNIFKKYTTSVHADKYHPLLEEKEPEYVALTRKPMLPTDEEISRNNRSKASILRALERK